MQRQVSVAACPAHPRRWRARQGGGNPLIPLVTMPGVKDYAPEQVGIAVRFSCTSLAEGKCKYESVDKFR